MTDHDTDLLSDDEREGEGKFGRVLKTALITALIVVLAAGVLFLLAERNARRYFLVAEGGSLLVQKGIFFPVGERRFTPEEPDFADAYHPVSIPQGADVQPRQSFNERTELDRVLVDMLLTWSRERLDPGHPDLLEQGIYYLRRVENLPTTTASQRGEMEILRGEVAYHEGRRFIEAALRNLDTARERLMTARDSPAGWGRESRQLLRTIRDPEDALRQALREDEVERVLPVPEVEEPEIKPDDSEGEPVLDEEPEDPIIVPPPPPPVVDEEASRVAPTPAPRTEPEASPEGTTISPIEWPALPPSATEPEAPAEDPPPPRRRRAAPAPAPAVEADESEGEGDLGDHQ